MNTSLFVLLVIFCDVVECIKVQSSIANLVDDIITQLTRSEPGSHDVVLAGLKDPILEDAFQSLSSRSEVTFQFLQSGIFAESTSGKKISLLFVDCADMTNLVQLNVLMKKMAKCGMWQSKTKVVVFMRKARSNLMKSYQKNLSLYGTTSALFVEIEDFSVRYFMMKIFDKTIKSVKTPINALFASSFRNLMQYEFKIRINPAIPFHHYVSEHRALGIDVEIVEIIVKHLNGFVKYYMLYPDINVQNQQFDLSLQYLRNLEHVDHVFLPNQEQVCITVPKKHNRVMFIQLFRPFSGEVWIFVVTVACYHLIFQNHVTRLIKKRLSSRFQIIQPTLNIFCKHHVRFFIVTTQILNFILIEAYLAKVITFLTTMQYEPNPRTLTDLDLRRQSFIVNQQEAYILSNYPNLKLVHYSNKNPDFFEKYATVVYCKIAEYWCHSKVNYNPETNDQKAFILDERPASVMNFYSFRKFSPFSELFQDYINQLADTGIWSKIYNQWSTSLGQFETFLENNDRLITFDDMVSLWVVTTVAYLICICVFICELILTNMKKKEQTVTKLISKFECKI
ncbi:uncharacterized protein LOC120413527 [Culex pipiens pallens]|uniref:uncharacterized protein LOC120413527 n=1 Tax=Culex pipiens pallens TaxID=42434 RepID=UPI001954EF71|nr:uncharacterized protein LOC120413527 [Culex pipiens pallens]